MKKILLWLLVITMTMSTFVFPTIVSAEEATEGETTTEDSTTETVTPTLTEKVHFNIDFEDYKTTDTAFPKADETHGYGTWMNRMSAAGEIIQGEDGNAFKITKAAESGMFNRYKFNTAITTGKVLLSCDMRYNVNGTAGRQTWMFFNNDATVGNVYLLSLENPTTANGPSVGIIKGSHSTNSILFNAANNDKMYHIDVLFDVDTKTKTFFLDGEYVTSHTYSGTTLPSVGLTSIKFNLNANVAAIDNFTLIENPKNFSFSASDATTEENSVTVKFTDPMETPVASDFKVTNANGEEIKIAGVNKLDGNTFNVLAENNWTAGEYKIEIVNDSYSSLFGTTPENTFAEFKVTPALSYFDIDFEGLKDSAIQNYLDGNYATNGSWTIDGGAEVYPTQSNGYGDASTGLYATDTQGATNVRRNIGYALTTPVTEGKITISFDAAFDSTINTARMQMLYINNDANNGNILTYGTGVDETANSKVIAGAKADLHYSGGKLFSYEDNTTYRWDTVIDLDANTVTNYCDGVAFNTVTLTDAIAEKHATVSSVYLRLTPSVVFLDNYRVSYNKSGFDLSATDVPSNSSETYVEFGDTIAEENVSLIFKDAAGNVVTPLTVTKISPRKFSVVFGELTEGTHTVTATAGMKSALGTTLKNNTATFNVAVRPNIPTEYVEYDMIREQPKAFDFEGAVAKPDQYTETNAETGETTKVTYNDTIWKVSGGPSDGHVFALTTDKIPAQNGENCVELRSTDNSTMCAFYANRFWMGKQGDEVSGYLWAYWPSTTTSQYLYVELASYNSSGQIAVLAKSAKYNAGDLPYDTWVKIPINPVSGVQLTYAIQVKVRFKGIEPIYIDNISVGTVESYPDGYYIVDATHSEENGVVTATATAKKRNYWDSKAVTVFGAVYDKNDVLVNAKTFNVKADAEETPLSFTTNTDNLKVVKWFVMESDGSLRPLAESRKDYKPTFKILCHNVGKYSHGAGAGVPTATIDEATEVYLDFLNEVDADVFCAQEHAHFFDDKETVTATEQVFGKYYDYNFKSSYNKNYVYQGQAIYSKLPFVDTGMGDLATDLEGRDASQRGYTKVVIEIEGKEVAIFNSHFSLGGVDFRNPSREVLIEEMNKYEYAILCMDSNSGIAEHQQFVDAGYVLGNGHEGAFITTTLKDDDLRNTEDRHFVGSNCIDQIIVSSTLEIMNFDSIFNSVYSDHLPVVAEIAFK